jgi:FkbM family methyltransferase
MENRRILLEEGHQRLIKARHGYVLYNRNDTVIGRLIETYGEYFETEVNVFRRFVSAGDVVLDVGANIGAHSLALARLVGPGGLVFAFEPQRIVFQTLCANMALNSLDNVHCVNAAVSDIPGRLGLADPDPGVANNFGGAQVSMLAGAPQAALVERLVLDDFLNIGRLKLIKIDVEGMEASVLRGARRLLSQFKPVLYVENAFPESSPELASLLAEVGYRSYWHLPEYVTKRNYFANPERLFPFGFVDRGETHLDGIGYAVNLLCVHASLDVSIGGLRPFLDPQEHPYKRDYVQNFLAPDGSAIPIIRE